MLLLRLVGVAVEDIAADYAMSAERLPARYAARGEPDQGPLLEAFLAERGTSAAELIVTTLRDLDIHVIEPSQDLREIAKLHAHQMPWAVQLLLKRLGLWSSDARLLSYLLFEATYCRALIELGYRDARTQQGELLRFLRS